MLGPKLIKFVVDEKWCKMCEQQGKATMAPQDKKKKELNGPGTDLLFVLS